MLFSAFSARLEAMAPSSLCFACIVQALILLLAANGAPVLAANLLGPRCAWPVDNGVILADGRPLLGSTKTWRGLLAAIGLTWAASALLDIDPGIGMLFGGLVMSGDLLSSFVKRRLGKDESSQARGLDTVPESLLPVWTLKGTLELGLVDIVLIVALFFLVEEFVSPLLYKLHIRKRPY
ncbi:MAG: CDP-archaeol synthase [Gammaproteobacteria bacterium]